MKFIVKTPSQTFAGKRAGIQFTKGEATFEDAGLVSVFKSLGYSVVEVKASKPEGEAKPEKKAEAKRTSKKRGE
jgi:hypothetical protein